MVKWLLGLQSNFSKAATPVFRLLNTILENDGDVNGQGLLGLVSFSQDIENSYSKIKDS